MIIEMLRWWYGPGWADSIKKITTRSADAAKFYSISTLLKTLFAPWKRIQTTGKSFDDKMHAMVDNMISRLVGFTVRATVLVAALFMITGYFIAGVIIAVLWPVIPLAIILCIVKGVIG